MTLGVSTKENLGSLLTEAALFNSGQCNTFDAYVYEEVSRLKNLRVQWEERDLVEIIVRGIVEQEVRAHAFSSGIGKVSDLIAFLGPMAKNAKCERPVNDFKQPPLKRPRYNEVLKGSRIKACYRCGGPGHMQGGCTAPINSHNKANVPAAPAHGVGPGTSVQNWGTLLNRALLVGPLNSGNL
ncbi:unnamed protein product [Brassicogethes aeneus]|uniref:CCHC-type domain-containing protein n=1 Tax=Brassicogethes aeneus TaxID=1431903 RepID=A0A9P0AVB0_BRAAE|nr:unnamed protein product [Brassicogethes aeneus]